jgi:adenylylsulfate kinase-like enzyme
MRRPAACKGSLIRALKQSKLILVEGVPGSGKTTMAEFVHQWLDRNGIRSRLYGEGSLDHPWTSLALWTLF